MKASITMSLFTVILFSFNGVATAQVGRIASITIDGNRIEEVSEKVTITRGESSLPGKAGQDLFAEDVVSTGEAALVEIELMLDDGGDPNRIVLGENAETRILSSRSIFVRIGRFFASVRGIFRSRTPAMTLASEGTAYAASVTEAGVAEVLAVDHPVRFLPYRGDLNIDWNRVVYQPTPMQRQVFAQMPDRRFQEIYPSTRINYEQLISDARVQTRFNLTETGQLRVVPLQPSPREIEHMAIEVVDPNEDPTEENIEEENPANTEPSLSERPQVRERAANVEAARRNELAMERSRANLRNAQGVAMQEGITQRAGVEAMKLQIPIREGEAADSVYVLFEEDGGKRAVIKPGFGVDYSVSAEKDPDNKAWKPKRVNRFLKWLEPYDDFVKPLRERALLQLEQP